MERYYVAFCEDWCSTVPNSWINEESKCLKWPSKNENATAAAKKGVKPKDNWGSLKYTKLLGPYNNFEIARTVEIAAAEISTSDEASFRKLTDTKEESKRSRKIPARYRVDSSDTSSSDEVESDGTKNEPEHKNDFNYVPYEYNDLNANDVIDEELRDTQSLDYGDELFDEHNDLKNTTPKEKIITTEKPSIRKIEAANIPLDKYKNNKVSKKTDNLVDDLVNVNNNDKNGNLNEGQREETETSTTVDNIQQNTATANNNNNNNNNINNNNNQEEIISAKKENHQMNTHQKQQIQNNGSQSATLSCQNCCPACRSKLDSIARNNDIIIRKLDFLIMRQTNVNTSTQNLEKSARNVLPQFPISNEQISTEFNGLLRNREEARTQYKKLITTRGDSDGKKNVREVLRYILTDELCCKLSWSGQKKTIKVKGMEFAEILTKTITDANPRCTLPELEKAIQSWVQHGSDRIKARSKSHA